MTKSQSISVYTRLRRTVGWVLLITIVSVVLANVFTVVFAKLLVKHGYWQESKDWKGLLLEAQTPAPEVVLVGSSRVQNHFNTDYFNRRGHKTFNLGVAGLMPWEFPSMVQQAAEVAERTVVISVPAEILFGPRGCPNRWTGSDLMFYARHAPECMQSLSMAQWLQPLPINAFFRETFTDVHYYPCREGADRSLLDKLSTANVCDDPRGLMLLRYSRRWVAVFDNGDGLILPDDNPERQSQVVWRDKRDSPLQVDVLTFLRDLAEIVRTAGKTPVFIVEAAPLEHLLISHDLEKQTGARTLYMNEIGFSDEEIADHDHVGAKGNSRLTRLLYEQLFCVPNVIDCLLKSEAPRP